MDDSEDAKGGVQSIETGLRLLMALGARRGSQMLKTLAEDTGMPSSKAHRYLVSFSRAGLVRQDARTGRYLLGLASLHLGLAAMADMDVVELGLAALSNIEIIT